MFSVYITFHQTLSSSFGGDMLPSATSH